MSRFGRGWVALSRKIYWPDKQQNDFYGDGYLMAIWSLLIAWANVQDGKSRLKQQQVVLKRGQLVTSENDVSRATGFSRGIVRRRLDFLENTQRIRQEKTQHGTVITLLKYDEYQQTEVIGEQGDEQLNEQQANNRRTTGEQLTNNSRTYIEQGNRETGRQGNRETKEHYSGLGFPAEPVPDHVKALFDLWNTHCGSLPRVRKLSKSVRDKIRVRLTEEPDLAYWETAIKNLATSKFCLEGNWADFHWLIKNDTNHEKAHSNKYGNKAAASKASFQQRDINEDDEIAAMEARARAAVEGENNASV